MGKTSRDTNEYKTKVAAQPIETSYAGYKFRSRLEARWAIFFDACRVTWEYEPEGYKLSDGTGYLPDFLLRGVEIYGAISDLFVEVKGQVTECDIHKIERFATEITPIFVVGNMPKMISDTDIDLSFAVKCDDCVYRGTYILGNDYPYIPCINKRGGFGLVGYDDFWDEADMDKTIKAYGAAQQARFEHGEKPDRRRIMWNN